MTAIVTGQNIVLTVKDPEFPELWDQIIRRFLMNVGNRIECVPGFNPGSLLMPGYAHN